HDVEQHQIERIRTQPVERLAPVDGDIGGVALALQATHQQVAVGLGVVDHEDARDLVLQRAHAGSTAVAMSSWRRYGSASSVARSPCSMMYGIRWVSPTPTGRSKVGMIGTISAWCTALWN